MQKMKADPAVATVAPFGNVLRISGEDAVALEQCIARYRREDGYKWTQAAPTLEDVFIHYMGAAGESAEKGG
jgi:ABC-2 type transport system ATP-binding protein